MRTWPWETYNGDSFADGKAAMAIVGPWAIAVYGQGRLGRCARADPEGRRGDQVPTFSDAKNIGMYASARTADGVDFMKFSTSVGQDGKLLR
jgi:multiple sugar transport system substrate-binding protein